MGKKDTSLQFLFFGDLLLNRLPMHLRKKKHIDDQPKKDFEAFKHRLDSFLHSIPDVHGTQKISLMKQLNN